MKTLTVTLVLCIAIVLLNDAAESHPIFSNAGGVSVTSLIRSKRYEFAMRAEDILRTPVWKESDEQAPLSARKALRAAREQLAKLVKDSKDWTLDQIELKEFRAGRWYYVVAFEEPRDPEDPLAGDRMRIPVLMNGIAAELVARPWLRDQGTPLRDDREP